MKKLNPNMQNNVVYTQEIIQKYVNKAFTTPQETHELLRLECEIPRVVLTGSYVLRYFYGVLEREIKDIDVLLVSSNPVTSLFVLEGYENLIGTSNHIRSGYNKSLITTKIYSDTVDFFVNEKDNKINSDSDLVTSLESIFVYKRKFNFYKAFKDYKEGLNIKPSTPLPF